MPARSNRQPWMSDRDCRSLRMQRRIQERYGRTTLAYPVSSALRCSAAVTYAIRLTGFDELYEALLFGGTRREVVMRFAGFLRDGLRRDRAAWRERGGYLP